MLNYMLVNTKMFVHKYEQSFCECKKCKQAGVLKLLSLHINLTLRFKKVGSKKNSRKILLIMNLLDFRSWLIVMFFT